MKPQVQVCKSIQSTRRTISNFFSFLEECESQDYYTSAVHLIMISLHENVKPLLRKNVSKEVIKRSFKGITKTMRVVQDMYKCLYMRCKNLFREVFYCMYLRYEAVHGSEGYFEMIRAEAMS